MFTRKEIVERFVLQYRIMKEEIRERYIQKILNLSDDELKEKIKKACGGNLERILHDQYIIN